MKGGVGKTTLSVNIAYAMAAFHSSKVLLIDLDPQFNATQYLVKQKEYLKHFEDGKPFALDIFQKRPTVGLSLVNPENQRREVLDPTLQNLSIPIYKSDDSRLDLIPSALEMADLDTSRRGTERKLKRFVDEVRSVYNYIFIDCPPTTGFFTLSAFLASDGFLIPVKPDYLSSIGLPLLENHLNNLKDDKDGDTKEVGIVFTMVDRRSNIMEEIRRQLERKDRYIFTNYLANSVPAARAVSENLPLFLYPPTRPKGGGEIKAIAKEFTDRAEAIW